MNTLLNTTLYFTASNDSGLTCSNGLSNITDDSQFVISRTGGYGPLAAVVDIFLFSLTIICGLLALAVIQKIRRGGGSLLDKFVIAQTACAILISAIVLTSVLPNFFRGNPTLCQDDIRCRLVAGALQSLSVLVMINILSLTTIRYISIVKPFFYEQRIAFSNSVFYFIIPCYVTIVALIVAFVSQRKIVEIHSYSGLCLVSIRSVNNRLFVILDVVIYIMCILLVFGLDLTIMVVSWRLEERNSVRTWDETVPPIPDSSENATESTPENTQEIKLPRRSVKVVYRSISHFHPSVQQPAEDLTDKLPTLEEEVFDSRPLRKTRPLSNSDSDLPSAMKTASKLPIPEFLAAHAATYESPSSMNNSAGIALLRRSHSMQFKRLPSMIPPKKRRRTLSLGHLRLLRERLCSSPITKLILILSVLHAIANVPTAVFTILELTTGSSPPNAIIWSIRLLSLPLVANSFIYVLARRHYQQQVQQVTAPFRKFGHHLAALLRLRRK